MSYYNVYLSRLNHMGNTTAERIRESGIRSFQKWMAESPHTVRNLSVERGLFFDGIILTSKDRAYEKIMFLNVANDIPLLIGDIMSWQLDNGDVEKWILLQEEKKTNGTYRTFWIVRCNYLLKWIDKDGHLQKTWSYFVSSTDDKIKGNFRTWNSLITPQPNKYAEILMPRYPIDRATNFIVEDESWIVVEYDYSSVPGVIYLSLTENKVNMIYDDLINDIADTDKLAQYALSVPEESQVFAIGDIINPIFTLTKNGVPITEEVDLISQNVGVAKIEQGQLKAVGQGETDIIVRAKNLPNVECNVHIVVAAAPNIAIYIEGADRIRLDRTITYRLIGSIELTGVTFSINSELASIEKIENNTCVVRANDKNKLGEFVLVATCDQSAEEYNKQIKVIPLW